ncbi:hypothetical protein UFOVP853_37 [uncultured Caudovirales phage]|uniref:Uncharacterized protein n=1 Tax=uncultured Caudovirales phage TaxID=2100421 RepID=A0A6J5P908_9CAUD|nr:hypothetical protein UFOVP853_37 [uncultured Caudovirales phage]
MTAHAARPQVTERIKIRISATRTVEREITRYSDTLLIDRMHHAGQLSDRQYGAGARLHALFQAAGLGARVSARYGDSPRSDEEAEDAAAEAGDGGDARVGYRRLLRDAGGLMGPVLDALMHDQHPGVRWLATCQEALDWLADEWGMER